MVALESPAAILPQVLCNYPGGKMTKMVDLGYSIGLAIALLQRSQLP